MYGHTIHQNSGEQTTSLCVLLDSAFLWRTDGAARINLSNFMDLSATCENDSSLAFWILITSSMTWELQSSLKAFFGRKAICLTFSLKARIRSACKSEIC